jgi:hypothetical protein
LEAVADGTRAAHGPRWSVEGRHEAVANRLDELIPVALDLTMRNRGVMLQQLAPSLIAPLGGRHSSIPRCR